MPWSCTSTETAENRPSGSCCTCTGDQTVPTRCTALATRSWNGMVGGRGSSPGSFSVCHVDFASESAAAAWEAAAAWRGGRSLAWGAWRAPRRRERKRRGAGRGGGGARGGGASWWLAGCRTLNPSEGGRRGEKSQGGRGTSPARWSKTGAGAGAGAGARARAERRGGWRV